MKTVFKYNPNKINILFTLSRSVTNVILTGPYGKLSKNFCKDLKFFIQNPGTLIIAYPKYFIKSFKNIILLKTIFSLLNNAIKDLSNGFMLQIDSRGIGFKLLKDKCYLFFVMGLSYILCYKIPVYMYITYLTKTESILSFISYDRVYLCNLIYFLLSLKKLDYYKGKGFYFVQESLKLKEKQKRVS